MSKLFANLILLIHLALVFVILFGWHFESIKLVYISALVLTLASEVFLGYCILTKWEFDLRKKDEPNLDYDYSFLSYYAYKLFGNRIPGKFIKYPALGFLIASIILYLWNP